jgi:hypothetical protein
VNILTVNLLFSTFVFWVATRIHVFPKLPELKPQAVLLPILLLHSFRHLGLMFLAPGATYAGLPSQFAYPAAFGDLLAALLAVAAIPGSAQKCTRWSAAPMDLQHGRNGGPNRRYSTGHNLWSASLHGPGLLDTRVPRSCVVGDALHHFCCSLEVFDKRGSN